jgi:hypothetical protein
MFQVEKAVEIPRKKTGPQKGSIYPFEKMEVGDSFKFPKDKYVRITSAANQFSRSKKRKVRFTVRANGKSARIWRIK